MNAHGQKELNPLRILAIDVPKISQKLAFLGYWHKYIHGTPIHLILKFGAFSCIVRLLLLEVSLNLNQSD